MANKLLHSDPIGARMLSFSLTTTSTKKSKFAEPIGRVSLDVILKMKPSVHDNHLTAFKVDGVKNRIVLHTEYKYGEEPFEQTDVVFEGVVDHYFRNSILPSIIFDVEEVDIKSIILRDKALIDEGHKVGGWPSFWAESINLMEDKIKNTDAKMFELSSSYGMDGWVIASSCKIKKKWITSRSI